MFAAAILIPHVLLAQLTTGILEGSAASSDGRPAAGITIDIAGGAGFRVTVRTDARGEFAIALPYGRYDVSGVPVLIAPFKTTRVQLGPAPAAPTEAPAGVWTDRSAGRVYAGPFSLPGVLLSREPAVVAEPLDFTGLHDNRIGVISQRALSWTTVEYKLEGIDATDSYQPGRPLILPDPEALEAIVVRSGFAQTASGSYGTEAGVFVKEPGTKWHGGLSSSNTGAPLSSSNLPPTDSRGLVKQPDQFQWFTRDRAETGGQLTRWADLFAAGAAQWSSQNAPLAAPGNEQHSRLLFANVRGRVLASRANQIEGQYTGSRIDLSDWGWPQAIETLASNRMLPSFILPGGCPGLSEVDHTDFAQAAWTRRLAHSLLQVRYGYSTAHLDTFHSGHSEASAQSRVELLGGGVTGAAPLGNFAIRTRHEIEGVWQPAAFRTGGARHQVSAGAGWKSAAPRNRFQIPSGMTLVTAAGAPAFVVLYNTPFDSRAAVRSFSAFAADHVRLGGVLSVDLGVYADLSRGSVPGEGRLIEWNSASPRAGLAWRVPRAHGLVLRGAYHRLYAPLAGRYLDFGNPQSLSGGVYGWTDANADALFQTGERGSLVSRFGGAYSAISPSLARPYADEFIVGAAAPVFGRTTVSLQLFRRDDKQRLAAVNTGIATQPFTPVTILDPGPDASAGTFDDQQLTVYSQSAATLGQDHCLLTNPRGLRVLNAGMIAELHSEWRGVVAHASFVAEKTHGPANPGNAVYENDPGVLGGLYLDPNTAINSTGRSFMDRAYVGKLQATYRVPRLRIDVSSVANYLDGLVFARRMLVTGLTQGPSVISTTVRGSPEGGNRAEYVFNWNLRFQREFRLPFGRLAGWTDVLNVTNAGHKIQQIDLSGPRFNERLPVAIQEARAVRLGFRYEF